MELEKLFSSRVQVSRFQKSAARVFTPEQALAEEIWNYFYKKLPFPRIMRIIKIWGQQKTYEIFNEVRQSDAQNRLSLFIWKTKTKK